jgi:hypothetical protein
MTMMISMLSCRSVIEYLEDAELLEVWGDCLRSLDSKRTLLVGALGGVAPMLVKGEVTVSDHE